MSTDLGVAPMSAPSGLRGWIYDRLVAGMTSDWYRAVLARLPDGARVLDVGIGTGAALARCADLVRAKQLEIVGLDIDPDYLRRCRAELLRAGLAGAGPRRCSRRSTTTTAGPTTRCTSAPA